MRNIEKKLWPLWMAAVVFMSAPSWAQQRVRFPSSTVADDTPSQPGPSTRTLAPQTSTVTPQTSAFTPSYPSTRSGSNLTPVPPASAAGSGYAPSGGSVGYAPSNGSVGYPPSTGGATLGQPAFDPYSSHSGTNGGATLFSPSTSAPFGAAPPATFGAPPSQPYGPDPSLAYPPPGMAFPTQPPALFPEGIPVTTPPWASPQPGPYLRLFQDLRFRYTWVDGEEGRDVDINDVEVATTLNYPNFLFSTQPLHVSPVFIFHFWDGPDTDPAAMPPFFADLPSRAYSAFLDFRWNPCITPQFGGELNASVGVYSDFQSVTTDSIRVQGTGLLVVNLTPTLAVKVGVNYVDRVNVKILPAGGVLWQPNPQTRFDIVFPKPKLAQYLTTVGNTDFWWYVGGEYGGGSWTIERISPVATFSDQADINDIRVIGGLEWTHHFGLKGFVEAGYVFDREVVYRVRPQDSFNMQDTIMLRGGLSY